MMIRLGVAAAMCAVGAVWAGSPSAAKGPAAPAKGLVLPRFRIEEASGCLAEYALAQRDEPGAVVVVVAVDERKRSAEIAEAVKRRAQLQLKDMARSIGHMRLRTLMNGSGAVDASGLGMHNYGCFFPAAAVP